MTPIQNNALLFTILCGDPSKLPTFLSSLIPSNKLDPTQPGKQKTEPIHHAQRELSVSPVKVAGVKTREFLLGFLGIPQSLKQK